jgi:phosphomannomutase/phosphoglucomutase
VRLFGTNGIREVVGSRLTPPMVTRISQAISRQVPLGATVAVGRDGRTSSEAFAGVVAGTLATEGRRVVDLGLLATPAFQYNIPRVKAAMGVIVTASHNPAEFNGIKLIAADGLEVPRSVEEAVEQDVAGAEKPSAPFDRIGEIVRDAQGPSRYVDGILSVVDREAIRARGFTVALDCGNGASAASSPALLRALGCRVTALNANVDGLFPSHPSEPTEANLAAIARAVPALGADLGIVHDGDADRAVFIDGSGQFIPGERVLALMAREMVRRHPHGVVVTPVSSSRVVEEQVHQNGGELVYTRIGSPTVTRTMVERTAIFGGEENGGLIFPQHQYARDGAMTAAAVLELLATSRTSLADAFRDIPVYAMRKEKIPCPQALVGTVLEGLRVSLSAGADQVVTIDGVKVYRGKSWILVRPSGTEPLLRVFAEADTPSAADALIKEAMETAQKLIAGLARPTTPPPP